MGSDFSTLIGNQIEVVNVSDYKVTITFLNGSSMDIELDGQYTGDASLVVYFNNIHD